MILSLDHQTNGKATHMKLVRVAATQFDAERAKRYRNRGCTHFYQVIGNPEQEQAALELVDQILFSLVSFDYEKDWYAHSCTCPDYSEGYASNFAVDIEYSEHFKNLWKLIKAEIKQLESIPTTEGELLFLGFEIAKKIAAAHKDIELSIRHFDFYKKYYPELEVVTAEIEQTKVEEPIEQAPAAEPKQQSKDDIQSFKLKRPCKECPFRKDLPEHLKGWLGKERAEGIAFDTFKTGQSFPCHKTTGTMHSDDEYDDWDDEAKPTPYDQNTSQCAGAAIMQIKTDNPSAYIQVAERLGWTKEVEAMKQLDLDSPVFDTVADFIKFHSR